MGFGSLLEVASMPILQVLMVSTLGAFMATDYLNLLSAPTRKSLNKIVFMVFTPSLMFSSLAETVTFKDLIAWWFMPINIGLTFLFGGILGWIAVKLLKPQPYLEGLIIAMCSSGNLGNLLLIIVPAMCSEHGSPFRNLNNCSSIALAYASLSMALGVFFIWTYSYQLIRISALKFKALQAAEVIEMVHNKDSDANARTDLLEGEAGQELVTIDMPSKSSKENKENLEGDIQQDVTIDMPSKSVEEDTKHQTIMPEASCSKLEKENESCSGNATELFQRLVKELFAPPTIAAIVGFIFGAVPWLKKLIIGGTAPLRVIQSSVKLLGNATIPCVILILGGNLRKGFRSARVKRTSIVAVICVRYVFLPVIGIGVVKAAGRLGFLPSDPLFHYVLMMQFSLPPAMNLGTMTQLFEVGQEECSVIFLWTYLAACFALTLWSTVYLWILSQNIV